MAEPDFAQYARQTVRDLKAADMAQARQEQAYAATQAAAKAALESERQAAETAFADQRAAAQNAITQVDEADQQATAILSIAELKGRIKPRARSVSIPVPGARPSAELSRLSASARESAARLNPLLESLRQQIRADAERRRDWLIATVVAIIAVAVLSYSVVSVNNEQGQRQASEHIAQATALALLTELDTMIDIPAGPFQMSCSPADSSCGSDETPLHIVTLDAYQMDKYEVTNIQYQKCVTAGKCTPPRSNSTYTRNSYYDDTQYAAYPVIHVDWEQARAYCAWAGKRLPTEAEWEKAARGTEPRIYPWGDQAPDCQRANFTGCEGDTVQVGSRPPGASPYGAMDMAGNVWEWVADWYADNYYASSPAQNPVGPSSGEYRVLRGGSWSGLTRLLRASNRYWDSPGNSNLSRGFRCAR